MILSNLNRLDRHDELYIYFILYICNYQSNQQHNYTWYNFKFVTGYWPAQFYKIRGRMKCPVNGADII